jgi:hypothetical protein
MRDEEQIWNRCREIDSELMAAPGSVEEKVSVVLARHGWDKQLDKLPSKFRTFIIEVIKQDLRDALGMPERPHSKDIAEICRALLGDRLPRVH